MPNSFKQTIQLIKADWAYRCAYENKRLNFMQVVKFLIYPATLAGAIYRLQKYMYDIHLTPVAGLLHWVNSVLFTVDIDHTAQIDEGLLLLHASFIHIGPGVKIGKNCMLAHQNAISASGFYSAEVGGEAKPPVLGDGVLLGGGAMVTGDVVLGNRVQISMNSAVDRSYPDDAVLFGVPAKNVAKTVDNKIPESS